MTRERFQGRYLGAGRIVRQMLDQHGISVTLSPALKQKIIEETGCTPEEFEEGIRQGIDLFSKEFKTLIAKQREMMKPPVEEKDKSDNCH